MNLTIIDHVGLNVTDLARSIAWYMEVFDFQVLHRWPSNTTVMVGAGSIRLGLFLRPNAAKVADPDQAVMMTHVAFGVSPDRFALVLAHLKGLGIPFDPPEDTGIAYSIFLADPDGHQVEITTYHALAASADDAAAAPANTCRRS